MYLRPKFLEIRQNCPQIYNKNWYVQLICDRLQRILLYLKLTNKFKSSTKIGAG